MFMHGTEVWRPLTGSARFALENAAVRLANSGYTVERARQANAWLGPVIVTHLGVERSPVEPPSQRERPLRVGILGRMSSLERYKGHDEVLASWPLVLKSCPEAELVIIGDGDDRARLQARAADSRLRNVQFLGFVSDREVSNVLRSCRVVINLSKGEGFGLSSVEAVENGAVLLGRRGTVLEETLPDGTGTLLIEEGTLEQIATDVARLLSDVPVCEDIVTVGRARVGAHLLSTHFRERIVSALNALRNNRRQPLITCAE